MDGDLVSTCAAHSNAAQSCFDIPRELRNTCTVRVFQESPMPVTLKRYMFENFGKEWLFGCRYVPVLPGQGNFSGKADTVVVAYTPSTVWVPSPRAPRTTAQSPSHLPPSTPRPLHMRCPHPSTDTVLPPRHTPSTRPTGPTLPSPQEPPFLTHRHHTAYQQHIRRALCVKGTPRPTFPRTRRAKKNGQRLSQGRASGVRNSTITLTSPQPSPPSPPRPLPHHPDTEADSATPHTIPPWTTLLSNNHTRQALCTRRTPISAVLRTG